MKTNIILTATVVIISLIQYFLFDGYYVQDTNITNLITFFSISFGFYVTSLAIFVSSKFVSKLYKKVDSDDPSKTLLHTLIDNYRRGLTINLASIVYFIIFDFYLNAFETGIALNSRSALPIIGLIIINIFYFYLMLRDLIKIVIQEAKIQD